MGRNNLFRFYTQDSSSTIAACVARAAGANAHTHKAESTIADRGDSKIVHQRVGGTSKMDVDGRKRSRKKGWEERPGVLQDVEGSAARSVPLAGDRPAVGEDAHREHRLAAAEGAKLDPLLAGGLNWFTAHAMRAAVKSASPEPRSGASPEPRSVGKKSKNERAPRALTTPESGVATGTASDVYSAGSESEWLPAPSRRRSAKMRRSGGAPHVR